MGSERDAPGSDTPDPDPTESDASGPDPTESDSPGPDAPVAVELEGVTKRYGDTVAVDDVDLAVREGEFFTLVGPSGCGKTTTLRLVAGFETPTAGTVRFDGADVSDVPPEDRNVGVVFQNYALFPHMTVEENVAYGLNFADPPGGVSREERVRELLELVDLEGTADRDPDSLSGGQQQRVALARALAPGPDVLLLDEPMSALDARLRERLRVQVKAIQTELGITTIYVTHDQEEALAISDRVAVMRAGVPEQVAPPRTVYRRPATRFVAEFVGDNNVFDGTVTEIVETGGDGSTADLEPIHEQLSSGNERRYKVGEGRPGEGSPLEAKGVEKSGKSTRTATVDVGGESLRIGVDGTAREGGERRVDADGDLAVGDRVAFCVRPEALRVGVDGGPNVLRTTVESAEFLGETTRVHLDWGGRELLVRTLDPVAGEVAVGFDPRDAHVIDTYE